MKKYGNTKVYTITKVGGWMYIGKREKRWILLEILYGVQN